MSELNSSEVRVTHKGWFLACPVYIGGPYTEAPLIVERWSLLMPWFWFNETVQGFLMWCCFVIDSDYEPRYMIRITGELKTPKVLR